MKAKKFTEKFYYLPSGHMVKLGAIVWIKKNEKGRMKRRIIDCINDDGSIVVRGGLTKETITGKSIIAYLNPII